MKDIFGIESEEEEEDYELSSGSGKSSRASSTVDQIWNKIVSALELHINLGEGVLEEIPQGDKAVVHPRNDEN